MSFHSILFREAERRPTDEPREAPPFFVDLNLDQIVDAVTSGKDEYDLTPFFYMAPVDLGTILYRQEIMRNLEDQEVMAIIKTFATTMRHMREHIARSDKLYYKYQKESWFLDAVDVYCHAVMGLAADLGWARLTSDGLTTLRDHVGDYIRSASFTALLERTRKQQEDLRTVKYCVRIHEGGLDVRKYDSESDYSAEIDQIFERFKRGTVEPRAFKFKDWPEMNHVEAAALDGAAQMYPEVFSALDAYSTENRDFVDPTIARFDREVQFYVAYLNYLSPLRDAGLRFCYPRMSGPGKEIHDREGFDLALAHKLVDDRAPIICNDFHLGGAERIIVVSGPNQGGKTTFARTFGQLHYLAAIGCPVPGREAALSLFDQLFTHFERPEKIENLQGKLHDDLTRIHDILAAATPQSVIIMNEIFSSTSLKDAILLAKHVMRQIMRLDSLGICVTFMDELASLGAQTISMVATVVPKDPSRRTFKIVRKPADGLAYAMSLAERYRLTYAWIKRRVAS